MTEKNERDGLPDLPKLSEAHQRLRDSIAWLRDGEPHKRGIGVSDMVVIEAALSNLTEMQEALRDMLSGWIYIRQTHGDLYGVGWDRAQSKAEAALTCYEAGSAAAAQAAKQVPGEPVARNRPKFRTSDERAAGAIDKAIYALDRAHDRAAESEDRVLYGAAGMLLQLLFKSGAPSLAEAAEAGQVEAKDVAERVVRAIEQAYNDTEQSVTRDFLGEVTDAAYGAVMEALAVTLASPQAPAPQAVVGEASDDLNDRLNGAYESGAANARRGVQEVTTGFDDLPFAGCPESWVEKPFARIRWFYDSGDASVGQPSQSGWTLAEDQSGTVVADLCVRVGDEAREQAFDDFKRCDAYTGSWQARECFEGGWAAREKFPIPTLTRSHVRSDGGSCTQCTHRNRIGLNMSNDLRPCGHPLGSSAWCYACAEAKYEASLRQRLMPRAIHPLAAAVLQQEAGEPVAWGWAIVNKDGDEVHTRARLGNFFSDANHEFEPLGAEDVAYEDRESPGWAPHRLVTLYATPQVSPPHARVPLTEEQIIRLTDELDCDRPGWAIRWARAIERAHLIGLETKGDGNG